MRIVPAKLPVPVAQAVGSELRKQKRFKDVMASQQNFISDSVVSLQRTCNTADRVRGALFALAVIRSDQSVPKKYCMHNAAWCKCEKSSDDKCEDKIISHMFAMAAHLAMISLPSAVRKIDQHK